MKTLDNNEILKGLLSENNNQNTQNELSETLWGKSFDLEKFFRYLNEKIWRHDWLTRKNMYKDAREEMLRKDFDNLRNQLRNGIKTISESEVRRIMKELNEYLCTKREMLKEPFTQDIPYFRADYSDKQYYLDKIGDRSLSVEEYEKMQKQIEDYGSILARSSRRKREFGGWDGDILLSLTNWKIYDVEWDWEKWLESDYNWKRYYSSWSWLSWAWNFYAWKWSIVRMPNSRMDVAHPCLYLRDINGLKMTMCTSRWVIDENLPTIIKSWKVNLWVDAVLLSQKNHLEQWSARDLINTIETKGENLKDWPVYTFRIKYFDENLEEKEKVFTYKTNMNPKEINFNVIWRECFWIERWFEVEDAWSFIGKMVWIKKYNWKYVRLWQYWLVKEVFDEYPSSNMDKLYYDDIEIWDKNEIIHKKVEINPMFSDYNTIRKFNWWILWDNIAYKNIKDFHKVDSYELKEICSDHKIQYNESVLNDDVYHVVYEDDVSQYNKLLEKAWKVNMEFEYYVPRSIFEQFSIEYRKSFLGKKLKEKAMKGINISSLPEETQKDIARNYLMGHPNRVFMLQDSYDSWNCHPGTARFVESFNLSDKMLGKDLLKHKEFEKMLNIYDFRKIFVRKALGR